jgi:hypothetical protein
MSGAPECQTRSCGGKGGWVMAKEITSGCYWAKNRKYGFLVVMEVYSQNYDNSQVGDPRDWLYGKYHAMANYHHIDRLETDFEFIERIDEPGTIKPAISGSFAPPIEVIFPDPVAARNDLMGEFALILAAKGHLLGYEVLERLADVAIGDV